MFILHLYSHRLPHTSVTLFLPQPATTGGLFLTYYHQQDDSLRAHPIFDGLPPGLAFDPILYSQDSDDLRLLLNQRSDYLSYSFESARVRIGLYHEGGLERRLVLWLARQGSHWLINHIQPVFPGN